MTTATARTGALRRTDFDAHWRLGRVHELSALAHELADGGLTPVEARPHLRQIVEAPPLYRDGLVVLAYAVYGAAVAAAPSTTGRPARARSIC